MTGLSGVGGRRAGDRELDRVFARNDHGKYDALAFIELDRSAWFDLIEELGERYKAARVLRVSGKKGNRSLSEGDRSMLEGNGGKNAGSAAA